MTDRTMETRPGAATRVRNLLRPIGRFLLPLVVSLLLLVALWYGFLKLYPQVGLVGKSPGDVWTYLVTGPSADSARQVIFAEMRITLRDAFIGFEPAWARRWS